MNYLAHLYLAADSRESLVGNLLGDFARGVDLDAQPAGVREGYRNHHRVDRSTDAHARVRRLRLRFFDPLRHYAAVLVDVLFDHVLASSWERWSPWPLERFAEHAYDALTPAESLPEGRMRAMVPRMVERGFLTVCRQLEGVSAVLGSIERRARRPVDLRGALERWPQVEAEVRAAFDALLPELVRAATAHAGAVPPWRYA